jgi:hypothetical protein
MVQRAYRGDIETITQKALEKDKVRRYASATGLAGDIRLYLADEPITAQAPTASYRLGKFISRYRIGVIVTGVFALLIIGFAISMALLAARNARERDIEQTERARAAQVSTFLESLFDKTSAVRAELANAVGIAYKNVGVFDRADDMFTILVADRERADGPLGLPTAQAYHLRGDVGRQHSQLPEAESDLRRALSITERSPALNEMEKSDLTAAESLFREALLI